MSLCVYEVRVEVRDLSGCPDWEKALSSSSRIRRSASGVVHRDASVTGKMPDRSCILFDGYKATLEHKAAGEQGFSTAHKSKSLNTAAFHQSAGVAI